MKKFIFCFTVLALLVMSCSNDDDNGGGDMLDYTLPENIANTLWKCNTCSDSSEGLEYTFLDFKSETVVEGWSKYVDMEEQRDWVGTFTISNDNIFITYDDFTISGTIEGEDIIMDIDNATIVFSIE